MIPTALFIAAFALTSVWAAPAPVPQFDGSPFENDGSDIASTVKRGQHIGLIVGMVILGIIIASLVIWFLIACCIGGAAIRASNRRRQPYFYNGQGAMSQTAPDDGPHMAAHNAALPHHTAAFNAAVLANNTAAFNASTGAPPPGAAPPSYPTA